MKIEYPLSSLHLFFRKAATEIKSIESDYMWVKKDNEYESISYVQTIENCNAIAAWLYDKKIRKGDRVALIMDNCPEYIFIDQALQYIGAINVSIYPTLSEKEIAYILNDAEAKYIFTGSTFLYKKIEKVKDEIPSLQSIIKIFEDKKQTQTELEKLIESGKNLYPNFKKNLDINLKTISLDDIATLIYTSGTTGIPKGVMLTHGNFISNFIMAFELFKDLNKEDRFLSFLPLCHVYERLVSYYLGIFLGAELAFAQNIDTISNNLAEIKPTILACVPKLLERVQIKVLKKVEQDNFIKKWIFKQAVKTGKAKRIAREKNTKPDLFTTILFPVFDKLIYKKIKGKLGGRMRLLISGGGPLPPHVAEFFSNIDIKIVEGYGLTETSPFITVNECDRQVIGTVGRAAPYSKIALINMESGNIITEQTYKNFNPRFESEEGEICVKGPHVMKGYWKKPDETDNVMDKNGWFHTGDIGKFEKGYLKITDRLKNMIVNAYGKNIYPSPVENIYLKSRKIEQIFLIGDKREHITAIISPDIEEAKFDLKLSDDFFNSGECFIDDEILINWIKEDVKKHSNELAKFERIKSFIVKRKPFSIEDGELTTTLKVKRKIVETKYATYIDEMYKNN